MGKGRFLKVVGNHGTGYWGLDRAEMLLIGARGNVVAPAMGKQGENVWYARRGEHAKTREEVHSDKPERSFLWIEKHWPNTPKIELFARGARAGWARWGNQAAASA
jgi:N6-adenosine-specific RNA methylase IME4